MKKAYVIFPAVALVIFFGFYWNFHSKYEAVIAERAHQVRLDKEAKQRKEAEDRALAIKDALIAQEKRKQERVAKEAKDRADHDARQLAIEARDKAFRDRDKLTKQRDRLTDEVAAEKVAIAKLEDQTRKAVDEEAFLRKYVLQAETNQKGLTAVLDKIAAADAARAAAEAAAAAAAKKNS